MKKYTKEIGAILLMLIVMFYLILRNYFHSKLLENAKETKAILIEKSSGHGVNETANGTFKYEVQNELFEFNQSGDYEFMNLGDTVLIEYAIEDHSVARVKDKFYMKKYLYLKK